MRQQRLLAGTSIIFILFLSGCSSSTDTYRSGYDQGYQDGYQAGVESKSAKDYWWDEIYKQGYEYGLSESESLSAVSYDRGFEDGYQERIIIFEKKYFEKYSYAKKLIDYVKQYCEDPEKYLDTYDAIWGDLTMATGDIVFDTLTPEQRALVHFPPRRSNNMVFYIENGTRFHAFPACYTLLASEFPSIIDQEKAIEMGLGPCSKCVADQP